jgi:hypothetical protein
MGVDDDGMPGAATHESDKGPRRIQVVEKAVAEDDVEPAVTLELPDVVLHELEVGKAEIVGDPEAIFEITLPHFDAGGMKPAPGKLRGVPALEATEVDNAWSLEIA